MTTIFAGAATSEDLAVTVSLEPGVAVGWLTEAVHGASALVVLVVLDGDVVVLGLAVVVVGATVVVDRTVVEVAAVDELVLGTDAPGASGGAATVVVAAPAVDRRGCDELPRVARSAITTTAMAIAGALIHHGDVLIAVHTRPTAETSLDGCAVYRVCAKCG